MAGSDKIAVYGFGKIGQALAAYLLDGGSVVQAIDRDQQLLNSVTDASFVTAEPEVQAIIKTSYQDGRLTVSADATSAAGCKAVIICLPLSVDAGKRPDSGSFIDAITGLASCLAYNTLLVIETSVPVGFCRSQVMPALEIAGKVHGRDYLLVHSPERIKSGTMLVQLARVPKIIGGFDAQATEAAVALYGPLFEKGGVAAVKSIEAAEMVKMAGMMYRDVNIALANQLAVFADASGIDFPEITSLINSDGEANLLQPGIGVGGHCTPVYPYFMIDSFAGKDLDFTMGRQARIINENMPAYAASLVDAAVNNLVLVLGLAFRPGVKEDANSAAYGLAESLQQRGCKVLLHDPVFSGPEITAKGFTAVDDLYNAGASVIVLVTMHAEYAALDYSRLYHSGVRMIIDGRNQLDRDAVAVAGIIYKGIGR